MNWLEVLAVLGGGTVCALLFRRVRIPMWPITGGLVGGAAVHLVIGGTTVMPAFVSPAAQVMVGAAIGATIGPAIFRDFAKFLTPGTLAVVLVVGAGVALGFGLAATGLLPVGEAVLGMVPGGVGEMVAAAISLDMDAAVVAGMHLVRLLVVLWTMPLLIRFAGRLGGPRTSDPG
ncbi:AbrB family transcriptional regulator [Georgenia subflava]|uniref:AbrB family transcriptional regulator n=1 Tax=Georgenia subflava TaxID=1622177 RepID=A0A6N7EK72_9MICO|nr:AbrB family transcriptional regulator [Georgenia subflava]MPV37811.1 AbrB family transcriptional regulator [Georgenia subflava]